jgi:hypothetical protein
MERIVRQLSKAERRLLESALAMRRRRLNRLRRRMFATGLLCFGVLWGLTVAATLSFGRGPSWYLSAVIWAGILLPIVAWSYFSARPELASSVCRFESACRRGEASVIRIQSEKMVEFEEEEDEGTCYAFELSDQRIVFVVGQGYYPKARFPNSDFSLIDILGEDGVRVIGLIEKRGRKIDPVRRISAQAKATMNVPDHLQIIEGPLDQLESRLSA